MSDQNTEMKPTTEPANGLAEGTNVDPAEQKLFDEGSENGNTDTTVVDGSDGGDVMLITNPDDASKVDTLSGEELELTEEQIIARMSSSDTIRDSQTVPTGKYIITVPEIRLAKDIKFVYTQDADGNPVPVTEKSIGMRYKIHYSLDQKDMMEDNGYQMYHLAKKDGTPWTGGATDYKRMCANLISASLNDPTKDMKAVLKYLTDKKLPPAVAFNKIAASTDDDPRYFIADIKEVRGTDGHPDNNELVIGSIKDDSGYYQSVLNGMKAGS